MLIEILKSTKNGRVKGGLRLGVVETRRDQIDIPRVRATPTRSATMEILKGGTSGWEMRDD